MEKSCPRYNVEGSMTGRFAHVPFANVLRRSTKKSKNQRCACICLVPLSHDTKKCDTHVYTSFFKLLIRQKRLGN